MAKQHILNILRVKYWVSMLVLYCILFCCNSLLSNGLNSSLVIPPKHFSTEKLSFVQSDVFTWQCILILFEEWLHGCAVGSLAASQFKGPLFNLEFGLLSVWRFTIFQCPHGILLVLGFPSTSKKHASVWTGCATLLLCVNMCLMMGLVFHWCCIPALCLVISRNRLQIHHSPDRNKAVTEDEWKNEWLNEWINGCLS